MPSDTAPAPLLMAALTATARHGGFWQLCHEDLAAALGRADLSWELARGSSPM